MHMDTDTKPSRSMRCARKARAQGVETATRDRAVRAPARAHVAQRRPRAETPVRARRLPRASFEIAGGDGAAEAQNARAPRLKRGSQSDASRDGNRGSESRRENARAYDHLTPSEERRVHEPGAPPVTNPFQDVVPPEGIRLTPRHYAYLKI